MLWKTLRQWYLRILVMFSLVLLNRTGPLPPVVLEYCAVLLYVHTLTPNLYCLCSWSPGSRRLSSWMCGCFATTTALLSTVVDWKIRPL
ncbi:hypothetical protein VTK56DRAFT_1309 [Thermocarpiscus australiensis]